jgi:hypothetical protein
MPFRFLGAMREPRSPHFPVSVSISQGVVAFVDMSKVLREDKRQVIVLGLKMLENL